jgi:exodeoxyribonuclease VII large subunit
LAASVGVEARTSATRSSSGLSPLATLRRGYAVVQDDAGHVLASVGATRTGARLSVRVADGRIGVTVNQTEEQETP